MRHLKLSLLLAVSVFLSAEAPAEEVYHIRKLSEKEMLGMYTSLLRDGCNFADRYWTNSSFDPRAGFWGTGRSDNMNEGVRAISEMVFTCGTLLKYSDSLTETERAEYSRKSIAAIRYVTATHVSGTQKCPDGKPWGGSWQSAMWTATMGFGAWFMWDKLDADLQKDVERVVGAEADRFLKGKPPGGSFNDTKAEENGWNLICLSLAANMFTNNPHAAAWHEKALEYAMNTFSAPQDAENNTLVDGRPVKDWYVSANLHRDFTLENHGFFHPSYIGCSSYFLTQTAMHFTYAHRPIPQAATHHLLDTWHMFQGILLDTGEAAYPQGMDWELHNLSFINLFASLASYQKDAYAARMEQNSLQYMRAWQIMCGGDLTLPGSKLGFTRHAICCEQDAYGFLAHKLFGPPVKEMNAREAARSQVAVRPHEDIQVITHRTENKFVSFSWTNRIMGMVIPIGAAHEGNPHFTVPMVSGLSGSFELTPAGDTKSKPIEHVWKETPDGFETTGTLLLNGGQLRQTLKLISIGEKTVVYQDRVTAVSDVTVVKELGVPLGIENDKITGELRHLSYDNGGTNFDFNRPQPPMAIPGSWANVDGRLGVIMVAGAGLSYNQAAGYTRGISVCTDVLYTSFSQANRHFKTGEEVASRVAVIYVEVTPKQTAVLAKSVRIESSPGGRVLHFKLAEGRNAEVALQ